MASRSDEKPQGSSFLDPRWGPGNRDENERDIVKHIDNEVMAQGIEDMLAIGHFAGQHE